VDLVDQVDRPLGPLPFYSSSSSGEPSAWWKDRDQLKLVYLEVANLIAYSLGFR